MNFSNRDDLYWDVLTCLALTLNMRLRWREIRNILFKKYEKTYDQQSFRVILSRVLKALVQSGYLRRESKGHQQVYYFIPKRRQKVVLEEIDRRFVHKKLDEIWDKLTSEQRKKAVEIVVHQQRLMIYNAKVFIRNSISIFKDWIPELISSINNSSETIHKKYSLKEKQELLRELNNLQNQFTKLETDLVEEDKFLKKKWKQMINLGLEFQSKVVNPVYNGNFYEAFEDLLRKAIEEQDKIKAGVKN